VRIWRFSELNGRGCIFNWSFAAGSSTPLQVLV